MVDFTMRNMAISVYRSLLLLFVVANFIFTSAGGIVLPLSHPIAAASDDVLEHNRIKALITEIFQVPNETVI